MRLQLTFTLFFIVSKFSTMKMYYFSILKKTLKFYHFKSTQQYVILQETAFLTQAANLGMLLPLPPTFLSTYIPSFKDIFCYIYFLSTSL